MEHAVKGDPSENVSEVALKSGNAVVGPAIKVKLGNTEGELVESGKGLFAEGRV